MHGAYWVDRQSRLEKATRARDKAAAAEVAVVAYDVPDWFGMFDDFDWVDFDWENHLTALDAGLCTEEPCPLVCRLGEIARAA